MSENMKKEEKDYNGRILDSTEKWLMGDW